MGKTEPFFIYAIQIGPYQEVLYVNYATDIDAAFQKFIKKHPQLKNSKLRPNLTSTKDGFKKSKEALRTSIRTITNLEQEGYEVIAGAPLMNNFWSLYIIELDGDPRHLYIGQTNYPIQKRFQQHIYKFNPARTLLKTDNFRLAEELCTGLPIYKTQSEALEAEAQLADEYRKKGYQVEGGH